MPTNCRFYPPDEFHRLNRERIADGRTFEQVFGFGAMWYCPWYHDPNKPGAAERIVENRRLTAAGVRKFLSVHYWRDWAEIRPPITVICPGGSQWCVDQNSNNGNGWTITGETPYLTASPSIVVPGYHGFLQNGVFTDDLDGRSV